MLLSLENSEIIIKKNMTEFNNIKFVPQAPKTYEVRYIENTEQSSLSKIASYLGIRTAECSGRQVSKPLTAAEVKAISDSATKIMADTASKHGGTVKHETKTGSTSTTITITYEKN